MAWLFAQVWLLCLVAFLLGALATWLALARPAREARAAHRGGSPASWSLAEWSTRTASPSAGSSPLRPLGPAVDPALSALDSAPPTPERPATTAAGALDLLGVARPAAPTHDLPEKVVGIPTQRGPSDASMPRPRRGESGPASQ